MVSGGSRELVISSPKQSNSLVKFHFFISSLVLLFTLFCVNSSIFQIHEEMQNNTAFSIIKQVDIRVLSCDFSKINLSKAEKSLFKILKHVSSSHSYIVNIENFYKFSKCVASPNVHLVNDLVMDNPPEFYSYNKGTGSETQQQLLLDNNLDKNIMALIPSSIGILIPTNSLVDYVKKYNTDIYEKVHLKISSDLSKVKSVSDLTFYLDTINNMNVDGFKYHFFSDEKDNNIFDTVVPNMTDVYNIFNGLFGEINTTENIFKLSMNAYSGRSIIQVLHADFQQKIREMKRDLGIK